MKRIEKEKKSTVPGEPNLKKNKKVEIHFDKFLNNFQVFVPRCSGHKKIGV